ncbi:hypothetical protein [uncultured Anaerofustis sp.]|uniref:hypothetical protein n=1 Tax=uncultured Anaerofustis sp. TaxID=904996 RepID=UPI0025D0F658|nr:hypothetical protein [uncultured Anaerofustis sp.]
MSEIILTVDTPVLKGEKGDKGETGVFDYGELERIVELNLGNKLETINKTLAGKVNTDESHSMVDNNVISTFDELEKWVDNPFITKDENGKDIEEPRTIVKMFDTKIDNDDMDSKLKETKGELQNYIDEKMQTAGTGDMLSSDFDKDGDGVIDLAAHADDASTVNGKTVKTSVPENALFTDTTYDEAAPDKAGLMSAGDKVKLNGIANGATRVEVVDALDSIEASKALSANQGKVLNDNINSLDMSIDTANSNITSLNGSVSTLNNNLNTTVNNINKVSNRVLSGYVTASQLPIKAGNTAYQKTINFGHTFSSTPSVTVSPYSTALNAFASIGGDVSKSSFILNYGRTSGATTPFGVFWIAVGN